MSTSLVDNDGFNLKTVNLYSLTLRMQDSPSSHSLLMSC